MFQLTFCISPETAYIVHDPLTKADSNCENYTQRSTRYWIETKETLGQRLCWQITSRYNTNPKDIQWSPTQHKRFIKGIELMFVVTNSESQNHGRIISKSFAIRDFDFENLLAFINQYYFEIDTQRQTLENRLYELASYNDEFNFSTDPESKEGLVPYYERSDLPQPVWLNPAKREEPKVTRFVAQISS